MGGTVTEQDMNLQNQNVRAPQAQQVPTVFTQWPSHPPSPPTHCSGEVHVFLCPHCDKCKCGKATVKREVKRK